MTRLSNTCLWSPNVGSVPVLPRFRLTVVERAPVRRTISVCWLCSEQEVERAITLLGRSGHDFLWRGRLFIQMEIGIDSEQDRSRLQSILQLSESDRAAGNLVTEHRPLRPLGRSADAVLIVDNACSQLYIRGLLGRKWRVVLVLNGNLATLPDEFLETLWSRFPGEVNL